MEPTSKKSSKNTNAEDAEEAVPKKKLITERDIMIMNERIYMETTRLNLLKLRNTNGDFQFDVSNALL